MATSTRCCPEAYETTLHTKRTRHSEPNKTLYLSTNLDFDFFKLPIRGKVRAPALLPPLAQPPESSRPPAAAHDASPSSPPFRGTPAPCSFAAACSPLPRPT